MYDNKFLENTLFNKNFIIFEKKYYLADSGYHNINYLLCPYCDVKYNLKE